MQQNRIWVLLLVLAFAASLLNAVALSAADEQVTIIGTLQKSKRGIVLTTGKETYLILGQDLSALVGRKVKVSGKLIENYRGKSLMVNEVEIVRK
jgi:hypothetical protein